MSATYFEQTPLREHAAKSNLLHFLHRHHYARIPLTYACHISHTDTFMQGAATVCLPHIPHRHFYASPLNYASHICCTDTFTHVAAKLRLSHIPHRHFYARRCKIYSTQTPLRNAPLHYAFHIFHKETYPQGHRLIMSARYSAQTHSARSR